MRGDWIAMLVSGRNKGRNQFDPLAPNSEFDQPFRLILVPVYVQTRATIQCAEVECVTVEIQQCLGDLQSAFRLYSDSAAVFIRTDEEYS